MPELNQEVSDSAVGDLYFDLIKERYDGRNQPGFVVYDNVAKLFHKPFFVQHFAEARRALAYECVTPGTTLSQNPRDFSLYHIGYLDLQKCTITQFISEHNDDTDHAFVCTLDQLLE